MALLHSLLAAAALATAAVAPGCGTDANTPGAAPPSVIQAPAPDLASPDEPEEAEPAAEAPAPAPAPAEPTAADPASKRDAYLAALRAAGVPSTPTGDTEVTVAEGVCQRSAAGATPDQLSAGLARAAAPTLNAAQARAVVQAALTHYC